MPGTDMPQHPTLVHQILLRAHSLVIASENEEDPPLAGLLARAADHVQAEDGEHLDPHALTRAVAEAAARLLARCKIPVTADDPNAATTCRPSTDSRVRPALACSPWPSGTRHPTPTASCRPPSSPRPRDDRRPRGAT